MASEYLKALEKELEGDLLETGEFRGDETALVRRSAWKEAALTLRGLGCDMLIDLCAVDYPGREERFEVVAHLRSTDSGKRMRIKTRCPVEDSSVESLSGIWRGAGWFEREAFDLFGIEFLGHQNLKRILCHHEFEGHALRKDFHKKRRGEIPMPETLMDEMDLGKQGQQG